MPSTVETPKQHDLQKLQLHQPTATEMPEKIWTPTYLKFSLTFAKNSSERRKILEKRHKKV
jgi:hypothetical protein